MIISICSFGAAPTIPSSNISFSSIDGASIFLSWTPGDGANRIVVIRLGTAVTAVPVNGVDYNDDAVFGNGDAILPGQFVLYDNSGAGINVTGLQPNTVYHFRIYEYNGTGAATEYLTTSFCHRQPINSGRSCNQCK